MKKFDIVVFASKLICQRAAQIWGDCDLNELGTWASGTGFPLDYQGNSDLPYLMCKVSDMNLPGNEIYLRNSIHTIDNSISKKIGARIHPEGTIVFPKIGGAIATNKRRIVERPTAIDNNVLGIIPNKDVSSKWLYFLLRGIDFSEYQSGTSVPAINQKDLGKIRVPALPNDIQNSISAFLTELETKPNKGIALPNLPSALDEQHRIIQRVTALAARIEKAQFLRDETLEDVGSLLIVMAHRTDRSRDELLKEGWEEVRLGEVLHQVRDRCRVEPNPIEP